MVKSSHSAPSFPFFSLLRVPPNDLQDGGSVLPTLGLVEPVDLGELLEGPRHRSDQGLQLVVVVDVVRGNSLRAAGLQAVPFEFLVDRRVFQVAGLCWAWRRGR